MGERAEAKANAKAMTKAKSAKHREERRLAIIAYKQTPEYQLELAERKKSKKARKQQLLEAKQKLEESAKNVEIYVRSKGKERLIKVGTKSI